MNMASAFVAAFIGLAFFFAVRRIVKGKSSCGCGSGKGCSGCSACNHAVPAKK